MRIGVVVDNDFYSDIRVLKQVKLLASAKHEVFVLCLQGSRKAVNLGPNVKVIPKQLSPSLKNTLYFFANLVPAYQYWWSKQVANLITEENIEAIHGHDLYMSSPIYKGIGKSKKGVKFVLDLHENFPEAIKGYNWANSGIRKFLVRPEMWEKKEQYLLSLPDNIVVLHQNYKKELLEKYPEIANEKFVVYPNFLDLDRFEQYEASKLEAYQNVDNVILYFGNIAERRGVFEAINCFAKIVKKHPSSKLLFVGPVDKADQEKFFASIEDESMVHIPWIDLSELPSYLATATIALAPFIPNPQHNSGVANKIFQYMYGARPIVASDCRPQKELIKELQCGMIYTNQDEFYEALDYLILNPEEGVAMGQRGKEALNTVLNPKGYDTEFLRLYA